MKLHLDLSADVSVQRLQVTCRSFEVSWKGAGMGAGWGAWGLGQGRSQTIPGIPIGGIARVQSAHARVGTVTCVGIPMIVLLIVSHGSQIRSRNKYIQNGLF